MYPISFITFLFVSCETLLSCYGFRVQPTLLNTLVSPASLKTVNDTPQSRFSDVSKSENVNQSSSLEAFSFGSSTQDIQGLPVDLKGKVAFVAGVADNHGYGWAIAKYLCAAGATVLLGTWPPVYGIFEKGLSSGKFLQDESVFGKPVDLKFGKVYPLDAQFDTPDDVPDDIKENKRYAGHNGYTISEVAQHIKKDYGKVDILVHSLANGPEVTKPLLGTSRKGYLSAISSSSYSFVSMLQQFKDIMAPGSSAMALSYIASEKVIPGYGGGMSSAKAALESDCRTLAYEMGRGYGVRVNCISAGPLKSRAASAIGKEGDKAFIDYAIDYSTANAPLSRDLTNEDVGSSALFLLSPLASAISGVTLYVDNGLHSMGQALDSKSLSRG